MSKYAFLSLLLIVGLLVACNTGNSPKNGPKSPTLDEQDPEQVVAAIEQTLKGLPAYSCKLDMTVHIQAQGMNNKMISEYDVRVKKPNRWAIVQKTGMMGGTSVSNGDQVTTYLPMLSRYSVEDVSDQGIPGIAGAGPMQAMGMMGPASLAPFFLGKGLADALLEGVQSSEHLGTEDIDGIACEHYRFKQAEGMQWDLWVEVGEHVLARRFAMKVDVPEAGGPAAGMKMGLELEFANWETVAEFTEDDFVFQPPAGANKVESLFGDLGGGAERPQHPLVGEDAPTFDVKHLDGSNFSLGEELGEKVIVLDFWATWCGPCTAALPGLAKVAKELEGKAVAIYAVNQGENASEITEFLAAEELDLQVLLDHDSSIGELYGVEGIPMTAVIGQDRRVQVVHVGYSRGLEKQLKKEVEQLLAGEDLVAAAEEKATAREEKLKADVKEFGTAELWKLDGTYSAVATSEGSGEILALSRSKLVRLSADGEVLSKVELEQAGQLLRLGNLTGDSEPEYVTMDAWGKGVYACDDQGKLLWEYVKGQGVDDVACHDLTGDGLDEVIIGYNGGTGLHVLDNQGKLLWKTTEIGNVWHVDAGNYLESDTPQVVTTSASGMVHVYTAEGDSAANYNVSLYGSMLRFVRLGGDSAGHVLVGGSADEGEALVLVDSKGEEIWSLDLPTLGTDHIDSMVVDSATGLAAVGMRGGLVHIVDVPAGKISATVAKPGATTDVALLSNGESTPTLLVASGNALTAYKLAIDDNSLSEERAR